MRRKKGVCYCDSETDACKMQGQIPKGSMSQCVNTSIPINLLRLLFQKKIFMGILIFVAKRCMQNIFIYEVKYFTPIEMLSNIL